MEYLENSLTYQEYIALRKSVGWNNFAEEQVSKSIGNSIYNIVAEDNGQPIAMGRLIGDGIYYLIVEKGKEEFYIKKDLNLFHMSFVVPG